MRKVLLPAGVVGLCLIAAGAWLWQQDSGHPDLPHQQTPPPINSPQPVAPEFESPIAKDPAVEPKTEREEHREEVATPTHMDATDADYRVLRDSELAGIRASLPMTRRRVTISGEVIRMPAREAVPRALVYAVEPPPSHGEFWHQATTAGAMRSVLGSNPVGSVIADNEGKFTLTVEYEVYDVEAAWKALNLPRMPLRYTTDTGQFGVTADVPAGVAGTASIRLSPTESEWGGVTISVWDAGAVDGQVVDADTLEPVAGAWVLHSSSGRRVQTAADGKFADFDDQGIGISVTAAGYLPKHVAQSELKGFVTVKLRSRLLHTMVIVGQVTDEDGGPLPPGSFIVALRHGHPTTRGAIHPVELNADGVFRIVCDDSPAFQLIARSPGREEFRSDNFDSTPGKVLHYPAIRLRRGAPLQLLVTDTSDAPLAGVEIRWLSHSRYDESRSAPAFGHTDDKGRCELHMPVGTQYDIRAIKAGYMDTYQVVTERPNSGLLRVVLRKPPSLDVRILLNGAGVAKARVWIAPTSEFSTYPAKHIGRALQGSKYLHIADEAGTLRVSLESAEEHVYMAADAEGRRFRPVAKLTPVAEMETGLTIELPPDRNLIVTVTHGGVAVPGAQVRLSGHYGSDPRDRTVTDAKGQYTFRKVFPTQYTVSAYATIDGVSMKAEASIDLRAETQPTAEIVLPLAPE